ncbi:MAG: pentapeptide repeat-containing protein [Bacteroidota bacterium]|nr:pentapeptide repeat-containing protein [Bacteroidota bacterium]
MTNKTHTAVPGFDKSEIPPRKSTMDAKLIRSMATNGAPLSAAELKSAVTEHKKFLHSGGSGGEFNRLEVSGLPLNIYMGAGTKGAQLVMRSKSVAPKSSMAKEDLSYADMAGMVAEEVDFSGSIFDGSLLTDSFFANSNFSGASLVGVDLTGSDLRNVSFKNADLTDADFEIANCEGADFTDAILDGAKFPGTNLKDIKR